MTRTNNNNNNNSEHSSSRRSSSSLSTIPQQTASTSSSLLNESKDIINQNELTIQKLLLELQDDLKKQKNIIHLRQCRNYGMSIFEDS